MIPKKITCAVDEDFLGVTSNLALFFICCGDQSTSRTGEREAGTWRTWPGVDAIVHGDSVVEACKFDNVPVIYYENAKEYEITIFQNVFST